MPKLYSTITPSRFAVTELEGGELSWDFYTEHLTRHYVNEKKDGKAIIPAVFKPCPTPCRNHGKERSIDCGGGKLHRLDANVVSMTALGMDFDDIPDERFMQVLRLLDTGLAYWWWTTHSHGKVPGHTRARILVPFDRPFPVASKRAWSEVARPAILRHLDIPADLLDESCKDLSRVYYLPRIARADAPHWSGFVDGRPLEVGKVPGVHDAPPKSSPSPTSPPSKDGHREYTEATPAILNWARRRLASIGPSISGSGGHNKAYAVAMALANDFGLSRENAWPLLEEWNATCKDECDQPYPWSDTELEHKWESVEEKIERGETKDYREHAKSAEAWQSALRHGHESAEIPPELVLETLKHLRIKMMRSARYGDERTARAIRRVIFESEPPPEERDWKLVLNAVGECLARASVDRAMRPSVTQELLYAAMVKGDVSWG